MIASHPSDFICDLLCDIVAFGGVDEEDPINRPPQALKRELRECSDTILASLAKISVGTLMTFGKSLINSKNKSGPITGY